MQSWRIVLSALLILVLTLMLASCGGSATATSARVGPTPTPVPPPAATPTPGTTPAGTVIDRVEEAPWLTCGNCGNSGATGPTAAYSDTLGIATPSEDGSSTQFSIAASVPYTNGYFYQHHSPITTQITALTYEFDIYIASGSETLPQAIEFECQQVVNGWVYNFSWQALYPGKVWRIFDYGLKRWDPTPLTFNPFTPNTWHHVVSEYHNDTTAHTVLHDALTVDGVRMPVNITHNAFFSGGGNQFTNAVQLDSNSTAAPYSIFVDKMKITYR